MNSYEILLAIREAALEFDTSPISDDLIMRKLNLCYTFIYSHIVKSDDSRFGEKLPFNLQATVTEYELPKEAWGKRVEQLVVPYPPTNNQNALGWHEIRRVDFKETHKYNIPRIRVWVPEVWSVLNNTLYVYPKPITNSEAYLLISPILVPMGKTIGQVTDLTGLTLTVDTQNFTDLTDRLTPAINAFLSVVDYRTGEVKHVISYTAVNTTTNEITLVAPARTTYMGRTLSDPNDPLVAADILLDDYIVPGYGTAVSIFGSEYDQFLINHVTLLIRSSLNENDPETLNSLKENLKQLMGDTAGRPMGIHMKRSYGRGASYTRPGRIF